MSQPAIRLDRVGYTYPDGTRALEDFSLCVAQGERVAVLGPNGSGKSTLLHVVLGFLSPAEGSIEVLGTRVCRTNLAWIRERVGIVFQDPDDQLFCPTLADDVRFGPRNQGLFGAELEARVREALDVVGLWDRRLRPPHHLSVGEKKRAALATVLSMRPQILLLDEPSAHLDGPSRRALREVLSRYEGTILLASQDLPFAAALCARAVVLRSGRVAREAFMRDLLCDVRHLEHLGVPTLELCTVCPARGAHRFPEEPHGDVH